MECRRRCCSTRCGPWWWPTSDPMAGHLVENAEFVRFANHWQFRIRACRPYRAKTKGKVERPIRYLRDSFFYGREFLNDEDLDAQLAAWLQNVANVRIHRTTGERPIDRFERAERSVLTRLAAYPYRSLVRTQERPQQPTASAADTSAAARAAGLWPTHAGASMKTIASSRREQIRAMLADLKLPGALEAQPMRCCPRPTAAP